jgi:CoA:oxalate CoA-transferase
MLEGVRVIAVEKALAGPFTTMLLGDMGAEVIKIERPGVGDDSRSWPPFDGTESHFFMSVNRNKKSLTLDLKTPEGKEILTKLIATADVFHENNRPGIMEKLGFGYEDVKKINSQIIYSSTSGFGHNGPMSSKPAYDMIVQAMSGLMSVTGHPGGEPARVGVSIADLVPGIISAYSIAASLYAREKNNKSYRIDTSMFDCLVSLMENPIARYQATGKIPEPMGSRHPIIVPLQPFKTRNGYIVIGAGNDSLWKKLCNALGRSEWASDERFSSDKNRSENRTELETILEGILQEKDSEEWEELFDKAGIPCGPINNVEQLLRNPQLKERNMLVTLQHPTVGPVTYAGSPVTILNEEQRLNPPPILGEHSWDILRSLGYEKNDIQQLEEKGVI